MHLTSKNRHQIAIEKDIWQSVELSRYQASESARQHIRGKPYTATELCEQARAGIMQARHKRKGGMRMDDIKKQNETKKRYLPGYRRHGSRVKRIEAELDEIRSMKTSISVNYDGMPHGNDLNDLPGYVAQLADLEENLYQEGIEQVRTFRDISWRSGQLTDENERDVLFYRYVKGLEFWESANNMGYSERQTHRYHGKALAHIELFEDGSPRQ